MHSICYTKKETRWQRQLLMICSDHVWMFVLYPMQYVRYTTAKPFEIEVLILITMEYSSVQR